MNDSVKSVVVLTAVCLIITSILAGVNFVTAPVIEENTAREKMASLYEVLPKAEDFKELSLPADAPKTVTGIYADTAGNGYAITLAASSQYSKGDMLFTLGVDNNGTILEVRLLQYTESKDFGADYPASYIGANQESAAEIDTVGGVTYSSAAFQKAVSDALQTLAAVREEK